VPSTPERLHLCRDSGDVAKIPKVNSALTSQRSSPVSRALAPVVHTHPSDAFAIGRMMIDDKSHLFWQATPDQRTSIFPEGPVAVSVRNTGVRCISSTPSLHHSHMSGKGSATLHLVSTNLVRAPHTIKMTLTSGTLPHVNLSHCSASSCRRQDRYIIARLR
jgi:hypothetical protein